MPPVRLGAVEYLNARPLVYGLERNSRFAIRFDVPSRCAELLHGRAVDVGLIPSIEYLRGGADAYRIVPDLAIVSHGAVASVALYTAKAMSDVRSIALDTSSRTSVALVRVLCDRLFKIRPALEPQGPDLPAMLSRSDAALIIGDIALTLDHAAVAAPSKVAKIDLGQAWHELTGLPFVYAFWAGWPEALTAADVDALTRARNEGTCQAEAIGRAYFADSALQAVAARYLRDNIQYSLGDEERAGLEMFYRCAAEAGAVPGVSPLRFY